MSQIPFPGGAADQDVFFHEDKVCVYHKAINTWECRTVERGIASGQPEAVTTRTVYTIPIPIDGDEKVLPSPRDLPDLRTQYDVNWYLTDQIVKKARPPIISASPPTNHPLYPTAELEEGDLWIDPNHIMYYWDSNEWVEIKDSLYYQQDRFDDRYVNTDGDTMTGALVMDDADKILMRNTTLDFVRKGESLKDSNGDPILDADGNEQWDDNNNRFSHIESLPPQLIKSDGTSGGDTKTPFGIRVEIDDGNTYRNQFRVGNRNGDAVTIAGGTGPEVKLGKNFTGNQNPQTGDPHWAPNNAGGVKITGIPTPTKENPDGSLAVNKEYVDTETAFLQNEIIELEEELEAIIPSLERGVWKMTLSGIISGPGLITFYDDTFGNGSPTGLFTAAKSIWFHKNDNGGVPHGFNDVEAGNLLELFVQGSAEFGLYEVVEVHDQTHLANPYWAIDVSFVRTLENTSAADNGDLLRLKTFAAPSGGTASEFVLKSGDKMSGNLTMVKEPFNNGDVSPKIEFKSKRDDGGVYTNALSMPYNTSNTLKAIGPFEAGGSIFSGGTISADGNLQYNGSTRMYLGSTSTTHYLGFGTSTNYQAIQWDKTNGLTQIRAKNSYGSNGQVLTKTSTGVEWKSSSSPTYTISKDSNGNFYIS